VDLRQNSDVHEVVIAELLREAGVTADYQALSEPERERVLLAELASRRPLRSPFAGYSELTMGELAIFEAAAGVHRRLGPNAIRQYVISKADSVPTCSGGGAAHEVWLATGAEPASRIQIVPLFETIADRARETMRRWRTPAARDGALAGRGAGSDARLAATDGGYDVQLVLQGGDRAGRSFP
jgi:phosphoenolpyruvate carboxylase